MAFSFHTISFKTLMKSYTTLDFASANLQLPSEPRLVYQFYGW